jgi:hypothetical protein
VLYYFLIYSEDGDWLIGLCADVLEVFRPHHDGFAKEVAVAKVFISFLYDFIF